MGTVIANVAHPLTFLVLEDNLMRHGLSTTKAVNIVVGSDAEGKIKLDPILDQSNPWASITGSSCETLYWLPSILQINQDLSADK